MGRFEERARCGICKHWMAEETGEYGNCPFLGDRGQARMHKDTKSHCLQFDKRGWQMLPKHMTIEQWNLFIRRHKRDLKDISVALPDRYEYIGTMLMRAVFSYDGEFYKTTGDGTGVTLERVGEKTLNEVFKEG